MAQASPMLRESLDRAQADTTGILQGVYEQMILDEYLAVLLARSKQPDS
jgi:hypothetical protein